MTIRERFQIIGRALRGEPYKIVEKATTEKFIGSFVDFLRPTGLSSETKVSSKVLQANKGWVYRNNDVIAKEISGIEFELFSTRAVGGDIVFNPILQHPILDALDRFNEFTSASDGFYVTQSHKKLAGDAFWLIEGQGLNITNIFILPPDKITIKVGKVEGGAKIIDGYNYQDTISGKRVNEDYETEDIIHFKAPNPSNYFRGLGAVEAAADAIDTDWMAIEANNALFKRGLIGNFILATENKITPEQMKQLRAEFQASYGGVQNAFKVPILGGGLEPKSVQLTNKEMEFIAQQEWVRDKIASIFGNNKAVLGITDDVNRANAEATIMSWRRTTIRAEMKQITDTLNEFLVPRFGTNLLLGFKETVEEDETSDIANAKELILANIITPNEARERLGIDPIMGGDELRQSLLIPQIPKSLKHVNYDRIVRRANLYEKALKYRSVKEMTKPIARRLIKGRKKVKGFSNDQIQAYYNKQIRLVEAQERIFQQRIEKFIDRLVDKALAELPNEVAEMQNKQLFDESDEIVQATLDFTPLLTEVATAAGNQALDLIGSDKPYLPTNIRGLIKQRVELFATSMVRTDREKLIDIITEGMRSGQSIPNIRRSITDTFSEYSKMQAERITRTEVLRASNQAALDAWEQSGVVEGKQWLVAPGADEECAVYDGKIVGLSRNFYDGQTEFEDGDPPLHPNCRCTVIPVLVEERRVIGTADKAKDKLVFKVRELENQIDKRTKAYRELQKEKVDTEEYVKSLEGLIDES